ncbi:MAG: monovalent cation/H(+) antiporter subunit G [Hyphomicrobiaceae bacterium]
MPTVTWALALDLLSWACILSGAFFTLVGAIGLVRMPELFTRMHAASVTDTLGAGFLLLGMMLQAGLTLITAKLIFITLLLFFTGPVITHALAQAAMQAGVHPKLFQDRRNREVPGAGPSPERVNGEGRDE